MYWSGAPVAEVPLGVVTVISTKPLARAGLWMVIDVELFTTKLVPAVPPKLTAVAPVKFVPVSVITVLPALVPVLGLTDVTVGELAVYVN